jgi:hypothetical protein
VFSQGGEGIRLVPSEAEIRHPFLFVTYRQRAKYEEFSSDLSDFMSGAKKELAEARQNGEGGKIREGKEPLQFSMLSFFGKQLLKIPHDLRSIFCAQIFLRQGPSSCFLGLRIVRHRTIANTCSGIYKRPELRVHGLHQGDLGTHSAQKGAATYCASGSIDCPSITAIQLRAGWHLEGVTGRYLRFAAAGDQHVGRTVCGLDPMSPTFGILPPFFREQAPIVSEAIKIAFS